MQEPTMSSTIKELNTAIQTSQNIVDDLCEDLYDSRNRHPDIKNINDTIRYHENRIQMCKDELQAMYIDTHPYYQLDSPIEEVVVMTEEDLIKEVADKVVNEVSIGPGFQVIQLGAHVPMNPATKPFGKAGGRSCRRSCGQQCQ